MSCNQSGTLTFYLPVALEPGPWQAGTTLMQETSGVTHWINWTGPDLKQKWKPQICLFGDISVKKSWFWLRDAHFWQASSRCSRLVICFLTLNYEQGGLAHQGCDQNLHIQNRIRKDTKVRRKSRRDQDNVGNKI